MTNDDWLLQTSIKHGPKNDKGEPIYMTNLRGYTANEILGRAQELASVGPQLDQAITAFLALDTMREVLQTELIHTQHQPQQPQQAQQQQVPTCAHGPRKWTTGQKNGKQWSAWFCPQPKGQSQCSPQWAD